VTGFARLHGFLVGIVANNGVLFSESALKATHFIELCNQRGVPLIFLQNITGFIVGSKYGAPASPRTAPSSSTPSRTRSCRSSPSSSADRSGRQLRHVRRAFEPRLLWMWPNARSRSWAQQAASVLTTVKREQLVREGKPFPEGGSRDPPADSRQC
jgi:acetyl-CoA carboxylase carboxyltransferase component